MQADGSVVVLELVVFVLVLARSLAHKRCTCWSLVGTLIFNKINTLLCAIRLKLTFRSVTKTTRATMERGGGDRTVRDTHHASRRQCCRMGTCSSCFGTYSLGRSPRLKRSGRMVAHLYSTQSTHSPICLLTTSHVPRCDENDSRDYRT